MSFLKKIKSFVKPERTLEEMQNDPNLFEVFNEFGQRFFLPKDEWRNNILPGQLEKNWNDPEALYWDIVSALRDEFFSSVVDASVQLLAIDPDRERSVTIRGIVLMENGKIDEAETLFNQYMEKHGRSAIILNNFAKIQADRGEEDECFETLQECLSLNPNLENALEWFIAIIGETSGDEAIKTALINLSKINGSWRPQLWLARMSLEEKDLSTAKNLYKNILSITDDSDALMIISGDLGTNGYLESILELIEPVYSPDKHGPNAGFNLLEACKQLQNYDLGLKILHKMRLQNWQPFTEKLLEYANLFEHMKPDLTGEISISEEKIGTLILSRPIWLYRFGEAKWLEVSKSDTSPKIVFLPLNAQNNEIKEITSQRENDLGRLSRGVPLYLAESLYFNTPTSPEVLIFAIPKKGVALIGGKVNWEDLESLQMQNISYYITGEIIPIIDGYRIVLHLWDASKKNEIAKFELTSSMKEFDAKLQKLHENLNQKLSSLQKYKPNLTQSYYSAPPVNQITRYIDGLAQSLTLSLVNNDYGQAEQLWGERNFYGSALALATENPDWVIPKLLFASNLLKGNSFKSSVIFEFANQLSVLIKKNAHLSNEFTKLSPLLTKKILKSDGYKKSISDSKGKFGTDYDNWLDLIDKDEESG